MTARYLLRAEGSGAEVLADDVEGLFVGRYSLDWPREDVESGLARMTLELTRPQTRASLDAVRGDIGLLVLDEQGREMGGYSLWSAEVSDSRLPDSLVVSALTDSQPHVEAPGVWDLFRSGRPGLGTWRALPAGSREAWLEVAMCRWGHQSSLTGQYPEPPREVVMDGGDIRDVASFFCAIGEAFCGPGGYLGSTSDGLRDRLIDYAHLTPFRLVWLDVAVARTALRGELAHVRPGYNAFDLVMDVLSEEQVHVVFPAGAGDTRRDTTVPPG